MSNLPPNAEPVGPRNANSNLPPRVESKFQLVHIAARRAEQLVQGARPKLDGEKKSLHTKETRIALEEVYADLVRWARPEELAGMTEPEPAIPEEGADPLPMTESAG